MTLQCAFSSDLIHHAAAVGQQTRLAHLVPAPGWTTGWCSASCSLRWFESEPSCGPGTHPSSRPKSARPAANQEMKSQDLIKSNVIRSGVWSRVNAPTESPRTQKHDHPQQPSCWVCRGREQHRPQSAARTGTWPAGTSSSASSRRGSWLKRHNRCPLDSPATSRVRVSLFKAEPDPGRNYRCSSESCKMITVWLRGSSIGWNTAGIPALGVLRTTHPRKKCLVNLQWDSFVCFHWQRQEVPVTRLHTRFTHVYIIWTKTSRMSTLTWLKIE